MAISRVQVMNTEKDIKAAQQELPEAGQFRSAIASLRDTLSILRVVWNTEGGAHQTAELESCITELENYNMIIESELESVKNASVSYTTQHHKNFIRSVPIKVEK